MNAWSQPIGGIVKAKIDDGINREIHYEVVVFYKSLSVPDDSLLYQIFPSKSSDFYKINALNKVKGVGDLNILYYAVGFNRLMEGPENSGFFLFRYYNDKGLLDTSFIQSRLIHNGGGGYFSSVDYLPPIVYHHPAQKLSVGFLKQQDLYSVLDTPVYDFNIENSSKPPQALNILPQTGNLVAPINTLKANFPLSIENRVRSRFGYRHTGIISAYIVVDSTLTGRFNYGSQYENGAGFINVVCEPGKSFNFDFDYIDGDADSVTVECYNSYAHFGSQVNYTTIKKSDTLSVSLNKLITDVMYYQLPQPVNCIVYPYKNGATKPRYFSFNLVKDFKTGLTDKLETKSTPIQLYPNPTNGLVQINNPENVTSLRVINVVGQEVLVVEQPTSQLDLTSLTNGVYVVEITGNNKEVYYTKLIKN